jgi:hypothetical protein
MVINTILGYRYRRVRRCPQLTIEQKAERLNWCLQNVNNDFLYHIFID